MTATATSSIQERACQLYSGEILAPMVRASTTPLRTLALKYGANAVYTEEFVDRSLSESIRVVNSELGCIDYVKDITKLPAKTQRKMKSGKVMTALILRIDHAVEKGKLICQLGTGEPELALKAALHIQKDVDAIDINMGCPKKFSVSGGMGAALLKDPERACRIISTLRSQLEIPVSAKIRLLEDASATVALVSALIEAGANAVAIHGRRPGQESTEPADWKTLSEVVRTSKEKHPGVPILVNGDFYTRREMAEFRRETGADGILLARPALYNTSLFRKPTDPTIPVEEYDYNSPLLLDKTAVVCDYLKRAVRYGVHYKNTKYVVCEFMNSRRAPTERARFLTQDFPGGQTIAKVCASQSMQDMCKVWDVDFETFDPRIDKNAEQAPAGEHKYLDSYFLGRGNGTEEEVESSGGGLPNKRAKLEETSTQ